MSEPIRFYKGEETGIVHESYSDINTSLFKDQYFKALNEIDVFLHNVEEWCDNYKSGEKNGGRVQEDFDANNIVAFIGERGTGKTSCMETVARMLNELGEAKAKDGIYSNIESKSFQILKTIDPTTLDVKTNVLEVVIGELFSSFQIYDKSRENAGADGVKEIERRRVYDAFQKIKNCLKYLISRELFEHGQDSLIQLSDLALVTKLKPLFKELIDSYLKFVDKKVLVLQIDDIDLQAQYAYTMMEQIRKYFIQENVIVLLAAKIEQLSMVLELENTKSFEPLIKNHRIIPEEVTDMASRYLLKLLPINHRVFMPTFEIYADTPVKYYKSRKLYNQYKTEPNSSENPLIDEWDTVKYAITTLIYEKCRFLFYHSKGVISPIVPRNLRELRHLFAMLADMDDYYIEGKTSPKCLNNKAQFLNYLNHTWVTINIAPKDYKIVSSILNIKDASSINKVVLSQLHQRFGNALISEFVEIINDKNSSYNVSIADVYTVLDYIKLRTNSVEDKMLIFFIETFYSIKLYEYYDRVTDVIRQKGETIIGSPTEQEDYELEKEFVDENDSSDDSIRKIEVVDDVSDYELLVGGSFINTDAYPMLPREQGIMRANDKAKIDFRELKEKAEIIINKPKDAIDEESSIELQLIEFFALCISRLSSHEITNANYRLMNELYYKFDSTRDFRYVEFNLGAFFSNILNVKRAYYRVHPKLYEYACTHKESLYYQLLEFCNKDRGDWSANSKHALWSCASIRNYEILSDFINRTAYSKLLRSKGSVVSNLRDFFNRVSKYKIKIYDRGKGSNGEKGLPYKIAFEYVIKISQVLKVSEYEGYESFFDSIFVKNTEPEPQQNNEFEEFDIDELMKILRAREYAPKTIKTKIKTLCRPIFAKDTQLAIYLDDTVERMSRESLNGRIDNNGVLNILRELKYRQKSNQQM